MIYVNNTEPSINIKKALYMDVDDAKNGKEDELVTGLNSKSGIQPKIGYALDPVSKKLSKPTIVTSINSLNMNSSIKSSIIITTCPCMPRSRYIIRNYTNYIENIENVILTSARNSLKSKEAEKSAAKIIQNWRKDDTKTDIWNVIRNMGIRFLLLKCALIKILNSNKSDLFTLPNPLYYNGFLNDLVNYIQIHGQSTYKYKISNFLSTNIKKETLGDIWVNKEVSLYCCCSGISSQMAIKGKEKDIQLIKKLNTILLIPEVYEDFYKLSLDIINEFFNKLERKITNMSKTKINNTILDHLDVLNHEYLLGLKYIIAYLIHTAQKNEELAKESYNKIKKTKLPGSNDKPIEDLNGIEVYNLVRSTIGLFYKYYGVSYKLKLVQKDAIINRTMLAHINNICRVRSYCILLGENSVKTQKYLKITAEIKAVDKIEDNGSNHTIAIIAQKQSDVVTESILTIEDHYHVQFVDNEWHTVTMIHLPYFIDKQENGENFNHQFHRIKHIVDYLKVIFDIRRSGKNCKTGDVYPFKYSRVDETWSLITEEPDLNKTVQTIENENCNVVFYYIKEDIYKTKFRFAQFLYSSEVKNNVKDNNMDKIRIPLFLPKFITSGVFLGPYDKNIINYNVFKLGEYKDLVPIDYTEIYPSSLFNSETSSSDTQADDLILPAELIRHMKESDLNYAIKHYYSDFFIRNSTDFYEDPQCYCMNIQ
ncbi:hypothetical protein NEIG_02272 [Nematocida sp. ERTm5]|nr:hypothetical protein NEIG_02272 [Nematocida sp. ERTm5]